MLARHCLRGGCGDNSRATQGLFSPSHTPPTRSHSRSQDGTTSKAKVASAARPRPGHLLPRSCHSRLPRPHPPACLGPRWGPTLRARAPQRPRENGTWRPSRGKPMLGGRCKQLMERRAGRVECSGAPRPALSPAQSPAQSPAPDLASHARKRGSAPVRSRAPPLTFVWPLSLGRRAPRSSEPAHSLKARQ